jgi:hypothetical protein
MGKRLRLRLLSLVVGVTPRVLRQSPLVGITRTPTGEDDNMANVDVRAQIDKLNTSSAAVAPRSIAFEPAGKIQDPKVRAGPGSVMLTRTTFGHFRFVLHGSQCCDCSR